MSWQRTAYDKPKRYYNGDHDLAFATKKFVNSFGSLFREFALNLCPAVVDALKDKLIVTGFRPETGDDATAEKAWQIWQQNRMGTRSGQVHKEAVRAGDAYVIVWVDTQQRVTIYPQPAEQCTVCYDTESPGTLLWAAKYWETSNRTVRLNMYYPDRIERYESGKYNGSIDQPGMKPRTASPVIAQLFNASSLKPMEAEPVIANPYGRVPVFHFANNADVGAFGRAELADVIPVQDALNKSVLDMMVAMEFASYRQRWASGIEIEYDDDGKPKPPYEAGIERLWVSESETAKFGSFDATDLEQFLVVKDSFRMDFAAVSGTPLYYFMQTGANFPQSGESYRRAETRFVCKVRDRQEAFGNVWEDVMAFALQIENRGQKAIRLFTEWEDAGRLTEKEELENLLMKQALGIPEKQILIEAGYGEGEIDQWMLEKEKEREEQVRAFNRGDAEPQGRGGAEEE